MDEAIMMAWLLKFLGFCGHLLGTAIDFCLVMFLLYGTCYMVARYLVCCNDPYEWRKLQADMRSGCRDMARAFREAAPGVLACAKQWTAEKLKRE